MKIGDIMGELPILKSERLILRKFEDKDVSDLYEYCSDPDVVGRLSFGTYSSICQAYDRIDFLKSLYAINDSACWAIELKNESKVIGSIEVFYKDDVFKFGYCINKKYWNNGYTTEALKCILNYLFENNIIDSIIGECLSVNVKSQRVMEKNGLVRIQIVKDGFNIKGEMFDKYIYEIKNKNKIN